MHYILGKHKADVGAWKSALEAHKDHQRDAGLEFQQVWVNAELPGEIFFLFKTSDLNKAKAFLEKAGALDKEKQARGEVPELFFLESR